MTRAFARPAAALFVLFLASFAPAQAPATSAAAGARFTSVDVTIDPRGVQLAAYQVELVADPARVTLVGIEGGEHAAFKNPPYYDPKALSGGGRVILAALNPGTDLPNVKTRVARLHLRVVGTDPPAFSSKLIAAASPDEKKIAADLSVSEGAQP